MRRFAWTAVAVAGLVAFAAAARADDGVTREEIEALKRQLREQERKIRELEGKSLTQDEVTAAVERYLGDSTNRVLVGGADGGKAGFPMGGAPFISEGPNKIAFHFRNQVRYSAFLYSDDAIGTLSSPADEISDAAPRDRSGWELERLYLAIDGTVFCPDISYNLTLNLDTDSGSGVEKEFAWIDWKYAGEHHVRGGVDKVPHTYEEQNSSATLAFVDRSIYAKAFALDSDTGVMLWGNFGSCECPKQFLYKFMMSTGEGPVSTGSVFNTNAFDTFSDQMLFSAMLEWTITCKDWKFDEVDHRPCDDRCKLDASVGIGAYYENNDDSSRPPGLAFRTSSVPLERTGLCAWLRARYMGFTLLAEAGMREVDYSDPSAAPTQTDWGAEVTVHYRFANNNWGVGAKYGFISLDDDYDTITVGTGAGATTVDIEDTITEFGFVVNYFFWEHGNKLSADVTWVQDNSAVRSSSAGYLWNPAAGVVVEDGVMLRFQWQINF
jgi:hypothetical protein